MGDDKKREEETQKSSKIRRTIEIKRVYDKRKVLGIKK